MHPLKSPSPSPCTAGANACAPLLYLILISLALTLGLRQDHLIPASCLLHSLLGIESVEPRHPATQASHRVPSTHQLKASFPTIKSNDYSKGCEGGLVVNLV